MTVNSARVELHPNKTSSINQGSHRALQQLWGTKEYRLFPRALLKYLRLDSNISDAAIICWQTIFELAYFNDQWEIETSKSMLAKELGKSSSTIARLLDQLESNGYIARSHQKINNVWHKTIIQIQLPSKAIQAIQEQPNRAKPVIVRETQSQQLNPSYESTKDKEPRKINNFNSTKKTLHDYGQLTKRYVANNKEGVGSNLMRGLSVYEPSININNININNNNTVVVSSLFNFSMPNSVKPALFKLSNNRESPLQLLEKGAIKEKKECFLDRKRKLENLRYKLANLKSQIQEDQEAKQTYEILSQIGQVEASIQLENFHMENEKTRNLAVEENRKRTTMLEQEPGAIQAKEGKRGVTNFQLKRIMRSLKSGGFTNEKVNRLTNEIVHEVRFGSLVQGKNKKNDIKVDHSINIALKLVREGRWCTPVCFPPASYNGLFCS